MDYLETIEILKNEKECVNRNTENQCNRDCGKCDLLMNDHKIINAYDSAISAMKELHEYKQLGTLEEVRAAVEKQKEKKVNRRTIVRDFHNRPYSIKGDCPTCETIEIMSTKTDYCYTCGQKLNWNE